MFQLCGRLIMVLFRAVYKLVSSLFLSLAKIATLTVDVIQENDAIEPEEYFDENSIGKIQGAVNEAWNPTVTNSDLSYLNRDFDEEEPHVSHGPVNQPQHGHKRPTVDDLSDDMIDKMEDMIDSDWLPANQSHAESESLSESDESSNSIEMGEVLGLIDDLSQHCIIEPH